MTEQSPPQSESYRAPVVQPWSAEQAPGSAQQQYQQSVPMVVPLGTRRSFMSRLGWIIVVMFVVPGLIGIYLGLKN